MDKRAGWVVGRIAGAPVLLKPSALVMVAVLTVLFVPTVRVMNPDLGSQAVVGALVVVVMLMVSVFLHELAHAFAARAHGMVVQELALTLWGGHTAYSDDRSTPRSSAVIAIVGPLTNAVLAGLAWWGFQALGTSSSVALLLYVIAYANTAVALFNLLPGLPLDGGQVTEAVVWAVTGSRLTGTVFAAWTGRVLAVALVVAAIAVPSLRGAQTELVLVMWAALIGSFMWSSAGAALAQGRRRARIDTLDPRLLAVQTVSVEAHQPVSVLRDVAARVASTGATVALVLTQDGRPTGYVDDAALASVPAQAAPLTPAWSVAVAVPPVAVLDADLRGSALFSAVLRAAPASSTCLLVHGGHVVGLLRASDVARAVHLD